MGSKEFGNRLKGRIPAGESGKGGFVESLSWMISYLEGQRVRQKLE